MLLEDSSTRVCAVRCSELRCSSLEHEKFENYVLEYACVCVYIKNEHIERALTTYLRTTVYCIKFLLEYSTVQVSGIQEWFAFASFCVAEFTT